MQHNVSRAQLLRGDLSGTHCVIRPPWAVTEIEFTERCTGCGDCIAVCPDRLIVAGRGRLPEMDFRRGGCDFCADCLVACKSRALIPEADDGAGPWPLKATIQPHCLSLNAVVCRSCGEACDERAIGFKLEPGGVAVPTLDPVQCSGCGACFAVCPIQAIKLSSVNRPRDRAA